MSIILKGDGPNVGERSNIVATMRMFADEFPVSKTTSGWQKLSSGLIVHGDADKVVPKDPKETQLRDTISPPGAGSHSVDDAGSPPKPL